MTARDTRETHKPLTGLFADVVEEVVHLFHTELRLLRQEMSERVSGVANGGVMLAAGAALALGAFVMLLQAVVAMLIQLGLAPVWSYLIVAVVLGVIGAILLMKGRSDIAGNGILPKRSIDQAKADLSAIKERVS